MIFDLFCEPVDTGDFAIFGLENPALGAVWLLDVLFFGGKEMQ